MSSQITDLSAVGTIYGQNTTTKLIDALGTPPTHPRTVQQSTTLTFGTGAGKANAAWSGIVTIPASTVTSLNVSGGAHSGAVSMVDENGDTVTFSSLKRLIIRNMDASLSLEVGGDGTDNLTSLFKANDNAVEIRPGAAQHLIECGPLDVAGYPVATNEVLDLGNADAGASVIAHVLMVGIK